MKLVQLNTWQLRLNKRVEQLINVEKPDIICLQEVCESPGEPGFITTLSEFQEEIRYSHQTYAPFYSFRFMDMSVEFGNAILSRPPIKATDTIFTHGQYIDGFTFTRNDYNTRNFLHATVQGEGKVIHVITYHGYHIPGHKNGDKETLAGCQQISDYIAQLEGPVILAGDFNLVPDSESMQVLNKQLRNLTIESGLRTTRNDLTAKSEVCDYILVNDQVKVRDFHMSDIIASDHNALVLDFEV